MKKQHGILLAVALAATATLALAGCQPQANEGGASAAENPGNAAQVAWVPESDCATCHAGEASSFSDANVPASNHAENCMSCHSDEAKLADVHKDTAGKQPPKKLKKTEVGDETCLSCHSYDELAAKTADLAILTDENGTTVNPHEAPGLTPGHEDMACSDCHSLHSEESPETKAPEVCLSCHHDNVYECGTCHS